MTASCTTSHRAADKPKPAPDRRRRRRADRRRARRGRQHGQCRRLAVRGLPELNWAGFYRNVAGELGWAVPGAAACIRIPSQGFAGPPPRRSSAIGRRRPCLSGHIACDGASLGAGRAAGDDGRLLGVLDLDSPAWRASTATTWPAVSNWHACSRPAWRPVAKPPPKR